MDEQELSALISKTAVLMEQFERRCADIDARLQSLGNQLEHTSEQVPAIVRQSADGSLMSLPGLVISKLGDGLEHPVHDYQQRLGVAGKAVEGAARQLSGELSQWQRLHRLLLWKAVAAVTTSLALLLVGGIWLSMHYAKVIRENQLTAEQLTAYRQADIAACGDSQLCAHVDLKGHRFGNHGQYLPIVRR